MIPLKDIKIGKADAINYFKGKDKDFLNKIFFTDSRFDEILDNDKYFLLGEKGTGKTAYAVYSTNNETPNLRTSLKFTSETDFNKFIRLIDSGKITISDFLSIWKVILLLLISQEIKGNLDENYLSKYFLSTKIDSAIKKYYKNAFSPEIATAIEIFEKVDTFLEFIKEFKLQYEKSVTKESAGFQINLLEIENEFKKLLKDIKLKKNFILFIDGTDQIPLGVKKETYLECLRGLANAVWELNQFVFPDLLGNQDYYLKIVLLIRPDIFSRIKFHNANAKLKDNTVILDWTTTESNWKNSRLFKLADNIFASQQETKFAKEFCWDNYVDKYFEQTISGKLTKIPSFIAILRRTFMRPRDIFSFLDIMHKEAINRNSPKITSEIYNSCITKFSRYLLGEIKDQFIFFYEENQWDCLLIFFKLFKGGIRFDEEFFNDCYEKFSKEYITEHDDFFYPSDELLQSLFTFNIICYIEETTNEEFFKWSYKEKSYINIEPTVENECEYQFHLGLHKALGLGKPLRSKGNNH